MTEEGDFSIYVIVGKATWKINSYMTTKEDN